MSVVSPSVGVEDAVQSPVLDQQLQYDAPPCKPGKKFRTERRSWLTPFFGSNIPEPPVTYSSAHPCSAYSQKVHECLDRHGNNVDFCQSKLFLLQSCLRERDS
ncbi:hypothetical protein TRVL_04641 [Trypanosoma vivax]|nr:hypothetical protein TRVL_04641 [Trypanosoma vivax]